ncbi:MAG: 16S rRNA (cytosine(1402)-N(4))-methyltransferase RsmH [Chitinispirillaceae bacterium]|nr:16S rRNA (cytosine(1402)-N(4))-methyltransferase RsmH [Chitinispirillaceae bacterium]
MMYCDHYHTPVLSQEVCEVLCSKNKKGVVLDATLGGGGHFNMIARQLESGAKLIGLDRDPDAVAGNREHPVDSRATIIIEQGRFSQIKEILGKHAIKKVDGVIADLGVSSFQIDNVDRGFSFMRECGLDMRMNQHEGETASKLIDRLSVGELSDILETCGEVRNAPRMAAALKNAPMPLRTSGDLRECLNREYGRQLPYKVLAKVFMAIRISLNDEINELRRFLESIVPLLAAGGRIAVISYHSIEDRIVKSFFRSQERHCICPEAALFCSCGRPGQLKRITKSPIFASVQEIEQNPRARSARLRAAEKESGGA